ncbi:hypothetical protein [Paenibacillus cremeus]|uniref:Uncharacterized protein n=1 Tax=Paenibacillus cremeus TaxID=2163881 RepID=A0A559KHR1_9BACL|nr:hypothetical protein [Paenibacillus cremeus]TVY11677.1 hypothetical protein FPZ49_02970 [Paenibacillus cremeus]
MLLNIKISIGGELVKAASIEVDDYKLEELTEEEKESAMEIVVRNWADRNLQIEWEDVEEGEEEEEA